MPVPRIRGPVLGDPPLDGFGIDADLLGRIGWRQAPAQERTAQTIVGHRDSVTSRDVDPPPPGRPRPPRRKVAPRTVGKTYTAPDGKTLRPSLFVTLTCPSYGRVGEDGAPTDPGAYEYDRAARDALAFAALFDRFIQNLRRFLGYDVQYFAAVEPQRRLAPYVHLAMRGTVSRAEIRRVLAATYHQVWWPTTNTVKYDGDELPMWDEATGNYIDPATGEVLPTWDKALDAIGHDDEPWHVARFGDRFDAQGVLSGSKDASRCIGYLTKYLTKQVADCHQAQTDPQHVDIGSDENGRRKQLTRTFDTRRDAREELSRVRHETNLGTYVKPSKETVNAYLDGYLKGATRDLRASTKRNYEDALWPVRERLGTRPLQSITKSDVEDLVDWILTAGRRRNASRGLAYLAGRPGSR
jgi:hypothetical protein